VVCGYTVDNDLVNRHVQSVVVLAQSHQSRSEQGSSSQVKGAMHFHFG